MKTNLKYICVLIFNLLFVNAWTQTKEQEQYYFDAYAQIEAMLSGKKALNFKEAVFLTEQAFHGDEFDVSVYNQEISILSELVKILFDPNLIPYSGKDKNIVLTHAMLFKIFTSTIPLQIDSNHFYVHHPYVYDFDDPFGQRDWSNMFVSKLLATGKGNCHSLPYLYKILADELEIPCYLAFAPNHIYIKLFSEQTGWYNTELTNASFPVDAWIMASGYISIDAIRNGLYMDTLNTRQAIANCLLDLAHGYQHKFGRGNPEFVIKCCNTVLEYHPVNVNAMLTKAEAQKHYIDMLMKKHGTKNPEDLFIDTVIAEMYLDMEQTYVRLHQLGYRRMPEKMYLEWIGLIKNEPDKYVNKNIEITPKK